jgi:hypothetical protein
VATFHFSKRFIERCEEFIRDNPRIAGSPQELIIRSGRMALHILKERFHDCEINNPGNSSHVPYPGGGARRKKNPSETMPIRIPDEDVNEVKRLVQKLGLGKTVINFYYFATWMVLLEIWKLPEKPPY